MMIVRLTNNDIMINAVCTISAISVGFANLTFFTTESAGSMVRVLIRIDNGTLEREAVVYLNTVPRVGTATGKHMTALKFLFLYLTTGRKV